ncbi:hypothetical protein [Stenotrophomonas geniculata]|nr:hypothetical protein [Stenotrophomonas geniculata]
MAWFDGVFRCSPLGVDDCVVWWDAIAAVGTWAAALATFLAVLLPYTLERRKERVTQQLAAFDFQGDLINLQSRARSADSLLRMRASAARWFIAADWPYLKLPQISHAIQPTVTTKSLVLALSRLRNAVSDWNAVVDQFELFGREPEGNLREAILNDLVSRIDNVRMEIEDAGAELRKVI